MTVICRMSSRKTILYLIIDCAYRFTKNETTAFKALESVRMEMAFVFRTQFII